MKQNVFPLLLTIVILFFTPAIVRAQDIGVRWVVEPSLEFVNVMDFQEGIAVATIQHAVGTLTPEWRNGFIDRMGNVVIPFIFPQARPFNDGLAAVLINNYWSFIDTSGNIVIHNVAQSHYEQGMHFFWNPVPSYSQGRVAVWEWVRVRV